MKKDLFIQKINSNDDFVKITSWLVSDKEYVVSGQPIVTIETSKTNIDIVSELSGYILQRAQCGDALAVGSRFASVCETLEDMQDISIVTHYEKGKVCTDHPSISNTRKISNSAIKYIEENKLNPDDFVELGLVTVEKIKAKLAEKAEVLSDSDFDFDRTSFPEGSVEEVSFTKLSEIALLSRKKENLICSSLTIQFNSDEIRKSLLDFSWLNGRISTYILYVFSHILSEYPKFTAYYQDKHIYLYNRVNLGIAIDLEKGLKVAVIKDANTLSLFDLQMSIIDCIAQYYEDSFTVSSLSHSTITTTDLSNDGILHFQPILNAKQSVIMGIGGDQSLPGAPMTLTIVFDHRVFSGQEIAIFLKQFKEKLLTEHLQLKVEAPLFNN